MANFEYGMLPQGFVPKRLVDINNDMLERVEAIQDPKTGELPFANSYSTCRYLFQRFV